jgi:uncharacterized protein YbjT (DUF2867 family)
MMILVTDATGHVGKAVIAALADASFAVRALVRDPAQLAGISTHVELVAADHTDPQSLARALSNVDVVFLASPSDPRMVEIHTRMIAAAKQTGVPRLVQLSGVGANAQLCCTRTLRWLGQVEAVADHSGLAVTHLRPAFLMQNLLSFARSIAQSGVIAGPFRSGKWPLVDARDVAAVAAAVLKSPAHDGQVYTVTGAELLSFHEIVELLSEALGKPAGDCKPRAFRR